MSENAIDSAKVDLRLPRPHGALKPSPPLRSVYLLRRSQAAPSEIRIAGSFASAGDWNFAQFKSSYKGCILIAVSEAPRRNAD
jgi:hypothetical protein